MNKKSNVILFGFKGCGKTYFGKQLASLLDRPFLDTDHVIEELYQKTVNDNLTCKEIYKQKGAEFFRDLEHKAILSLKEKKHFIIAVGGGAILDENNLTILEKIGILIYLKIDKETLKRRTLIKGSLPSYLEGKNPEELFESLYKQRKKIYESIPAYKVDLNGKSDQEVLEILANVIKGQMKF